MKLVSGLHPESVADASVGALYPLQAWQAVVTEMESQPRSPSPSSATAEVVSPAAASQARTESPIKPSAVGVTMMSEKEAEAGTDLAMFATPPPVRTMQAARFQPRLVEPFDHQHEPARRQNVNPDPQTILNT